jgi:hypothetical protein
MNNAHTMCAEEDESIRAMTVLLEDMRSQPDPQAAQLLARLRFGESIESLIEPYMPNEQNSGTSTTAAEFLSQPQDGSTVLNTLNC